MLVTLQAYVRETNGGDRHMNNNTNGFDIDKESRDKIVSDTDSNLFVEAGAGSGKTTMLVNRMVAMVEQGKDIRKISAITFTKAAAGEFYERFQKLLIERSNPDYVYEDKGYAGQLPAPTEETRRRCEHALQNLDLCFMGTIDSFCNMIISEHPFEAGVPTDATIISDENLDTILKQEYIKVCAGEYGEDIKKLVDMFELLNSKPEEAFVKGMRVFLDNKNVHLNYTSNVSYKPNDINKTYAATKNDLLNIVAVLMRNCTKQFYIYPAIQLNELKRIYYILRLDWEKNLSRVLWAIKKLCSFTIDGSLFNESGINTQLLGTVIKNGYRKAVINLCASKGLYENLTNIQYQYCMGFVAKCKPFVEKHLREKGYLTYSDYLYYLKNMLREDAKSEGKLIRYIYDRHSYFLIDEFQDTNPIQSEIFFYLSSENPVENWKKCTPRPGSLFIVGDPKQSIYRFRNADVGSYLNVKHMFEEFDGCEVLYLTRNFRSRKKLCTYFNSVFSYTLKETATQSGFNHIPLADDRIDEFEGVYTYDAYIGKSRLYNPNLPEDDKQLCKIIHTLVDNDNYQIYDKDTKEKRNIRYNDIMVIVYGKKYITKLLPTMESADIPVRVEGKVMFESCEALHEIYRIYSALAGTNDTNAIYDALTSKLIGFREDEILKYVNDGGRLVTYFGEEKEYEDVVSSSVYNALKDLGSKKNMAVKQSPAGLFYRILEDFQVYKYVEADKMEIVYYTLELLRNAEKMGEIVSLIDGEEYIARLLRGETDIERCLSLDNDGNFVHLANLHKVKGLEAPVVILAYSYPMDISADSSIVYLEDSVEGYFANIRGDENINEFEKEILFATSDYNDKMLKEKELLIEEGARLVYVAATRARNALILCNSKYCYPNKKTGELTVVNASRWKPLIGESDGDFFAYDKTHGNRSVMPYTKPSVTNEKAEVLYEKAKSDSVLIKRENEAATYSIENPSRMKLASKFDDEDSEDIQFNSEINADVTDIAVENASIDGEIGNKEDKTILHECPTLLGSSVHKLMEVLVSSGNKADLNALVPCIAGEFITPDYEIYREELIRALYGVADKMNSGGYAQKSKIPQDMLHTLLEADEVYTEVPFCYADEKAEQPVVYNGIIDVMYRQGDDWYIVDYKTNFENDNLDKHYKAQLEAYKHAVKQTMGYDTEAMIYHIDV